MAYPLKEIESQAALWVMRADENGLSAAQKSEFQAWLNSGEQHREAYARLAALWGGLDILEELNDHAATDSHQRPQKPAIAARWAGLKALAGTLFATPKFITAAASIALVGILGLTYQLINSSAQLHQGTYTTALGERKTIQLPDGSAVQLNTNSQIDVSYSKTQRKIVLKYGEGYFDVAPNKQKPFAVYAGNGIVTAVGTAFSVFLRDEKIDVMVEEGTTAVGTAFSVFLRDEKIDVMVEEGTVALSSTRASTGAATRTLTEQGTTPQPAALLGTVSAGQNVIFEETVERVDLIAPDTVQRKLSWREGRLAFAGEPLSAVVDSISRYTDISIDIEDSDLRQLPIAGSFNVGEVDAMFEALQIMINVRIERIDSKRVRISKI